MVEAAEQHVGEHVEPRHQIELLEDHGAVALPAAQRRPGKCGNLGLLEKNRPLSRIYQTVDHAKEGRLAGAGAADDADHLTLGNFERDPVDSGVPAETARHVAYMQHGGFPVRLLSIDGNALAQLDECGVSGACQFCNASQPRHPTLLALAWTHCKSTMRLASTTANTTSICVSARWRSRNTHSKKPGIAPGFFASRTALRRLPEWQDFGVVRSRQGPERDR